MSITQPTLTTVSITGRTVTPIGNVAINDLRPRTPSGSLTFAGVVDGAVFDVYVQATANNQYVLLALPTGTSVAGRTDVLLIGQVVDRPTYSRLQWSPLPGGSFDTFLYSAADGVHFRQTNTAGYNRIFLDSPTRVGDLQMYATDGGSYLLAPYLLLGQGSEVGVVAQHTIIQATQTQIELLSTTGILLNPAGYPFASGNTVFLDMGGHIVQSQLNPPTIAAGSGAGSGGSASIGTGSTDQEGYISVTTGSGIPAGPLVVATISFRNAFAAAPKRVMVEPANANAANLTRGQDVYAPRASVTASGWSLQSGLTNLLVSTTYEWWYDVG